MKPLGDPDMRSPSNFFSTLRRPAVIKETRLNIVPRAK